jgi:hypothetical protein
MKKVKKKIIYLTIILVCASLFASTKFVNADVASKTSPFETWAPPANFVDPVTLKIQELTQQGLNNDQITAALGQQDMWWYPKTGAVGIGRALTTQELAKMPTRTFTTKADLTNNNAVTPLAQVDRVSIMRTNDASWTGVSSEIVSGSMNVASGQTQYHYICTQLGNLDAQSNWVETALTHNQGENYRWSVYDPDEGGWHYYMDKNTAITAADTYVIMLDGTQDSGGWHYDVWINFQWVMRGHLANLYVQGGLQKEVYSGYGVFTNDVSHAVFYRNWLHNANGWSYWTNAVNTWWTTAYPVQEAHSMSSLSYRWETWVQN